MTPFRIDGIALGSLLALLLEQRSWQERLTKWSGAGATLTCAVYLGTRAAVGHLSFYPLGFNPVFNAIGYSLVALIAFFMIAHARLLPEAIPARILRNRLLVRLGVISYGVYVYSWILLVLIRDIFPRLSEVQTGVIHLFVSLPVSAILFNYYERPITDWGRRVAAELAAKAKVATKDQVSDTERRAFEVEVQPQAGIAVT